MSTCPFHADGDPPQDIGQVRGASDHRYTPLSGWGIVVAQYGHLQQPRQQQVGCAYPFSPVGFDLFRYLLYNFSTRQGHTFQKMAWMGILYRDFRKCNSGSGLGGFRPRCPSWEKEDSAYLLDSAERFASRAIGAADVPFAASLRHAGVPPTSDLSATPLGSYASVQRTIRTRYCNTIPLQAIRYMTMLDSARC